MTAHIIIQVLMVLFITGGIVGLVKLPGKQKWIGGFIIVIAIVGSILNWTIK